MMRLSGQGLPDFLGSLDVHPRLAQLLVGGLDDLLQAAECAEQSVPSDFPDPDDLIQPRGYQRLASQLPVVADGKSVCLVANPLKQMGGGGGGSEDDGVLPPRHEDSFLFLATFLGQTQNGEAGTADLSQPFHRGGQLTEPAVDQDQVWKRQVLGLPI